ncbi:Endo-1,4-beta-xylanase A precursor [compost metagenome]
MALPEGVDPNRITTGVVLESDGTLRHVPTKVTKGSDAYYAVINSLTNSDYLMIWNPITFDDMAGHWAEASVNNMGSRLVVNGVGDGRFNPDADITRAEVAAIVLRALGLRPEPGNVPFTDVIGSEWYADFVSTAADSGLIAGYEDGSFRPQNKITRQEAMTMIARAMQITGLKDQLAESSRLTNALASFKDADNVASWAEESAILSVASKVIDGRTLELLEPQAYITRAEVATIVQRLLQYSNLIEVGN